MPAIGLDVAAKGRHLVQRAVAVEHPHGAELNANGNRAPLAKDRAHLIRCYGRREVPVQMGMAEYCVPYRATDAPRFVPSLLEPPGDLEHGFGRIEHCHSRRGELVGVIRRWAWRITRSFESEKRVRGAKKRPAVRYLFTDSE